MAKQRKNSNYVTEKTVAAKEEKALAEKKKEQIKQLKVIGLWSAVALLCVSIVVFVLLAIGLPHEVAHGSLRLSLTDTNTEEEVDEVLRVLPDIVAKLRAMSPMYDDFIRGKA